MNSHRVALFSTTLVLIVATTSLALAQEPHALQLGVPVEGELKGGETRAYGIELQAGQFMHLTAEQLGINVKLALSDPNGEKLFGLDWWGSTRSRDHLFWIAQAAGSHRLEVTAPRKEAPAGAYRITLEEVRPSRSEDAATISALRAFAEGREIFDSGESEERSRRSLEKLEEAIRLWRAAQNAHGEAVTLYVAAAAAADVSDFKKAIELLERAASLFRSVGDQDGEGTAVNDIGVALSSLGEMHKAVEYLERALSLRREAGNVSAEAKVLGSLGAMYSMLGDNRKALEYHAQVLALRRKQGDPAGEATALHNIGYAHDALGDVDKAREYFETALAIRKNLGERRNVAYTVAALALSLETAGDYQRALDLHDEALALFREFGEKRREGMVLQNLSSLYADILGDQERAARYAEQALERFEAVGDPRSMASSLNNLGKIARDRGDWQSALNYHSRALEQSRAAGNRRTEGVALTLLGKAYEASGDKDKALDNYTSALSLLQSIEARLQESEVLVSIGMMYSSLGQHPKAAESLERARSLRSQINDRRGEADALYELARQSAKTGDLAGARKYLEEAVGIVEGLRTRFASQQLRGSYLGATQKHYALLIDVLMRLHQARPSEGLDASAFLVAEKASARSLLELLTETRADIRQGADPALIEREQTLRQILNAKAERQTRLLGGKYTAEEAAQVAREISAALDEYESVRARIRQSSPRYAALTQPVPISLKEAQTGLLDEKTLLLRYAFGEERSYVWAVTRDAVKSYVLPAGAEIDTHARRVYELLTARNAEAKEENAEQRRTRIAAAEADLAAAAAGLSQLVLGPLGTQLGDKRLLVVADGTLRYVPFGALPAPGGAGPLVSGHEIVSLPSVSTLAVLRRETARRRAAERGVAVLADPVFDEDDPRLGKKKTRVAAVQPESIPVDVVRAIGERSSRDGELRIPRLPFSRREAEAILALAPAEPNLKALDFRASREVATSGALAEYRIVHFATHGLLNNDHPELSGVILSLFDHKGRSVDGFLRLHDVYNLQLPAELVVLSACQTALGKDVRGEGLIGLTRGFMHAGAPRVVSSLWKVDDVATAELMKNFYRGLFVKDLSAAAALREAKLAMLRQPRWKSPYYWAAFELQGEWK